MKTSRRKIPWKVALLASSCLALVALSLLLIYETEPLVLWLGLFSEVLLLMSGVGTWIVTR